MCLCLCVHPSPLPIRLNMHEGRSSVYQFFPLVKPAKMLLLSRVTCFDVKGINVLTASCMHIFILSIVTPIILPSELTQLKSSVICISI